jgi:hypothetical protein
MDKDVEAMHMYEHSLEVGEGSRVSSFEPNSTDVDLSSPMHMRDQGA